MRETPTWLLLLLDDFLCFMLQTILIFVTIVSESDIGPMRGLDIGLVLSVEKSSYLYHRLQHLLSTSNQQAVG